MLPIYNLTCLALKATPWLEPYDSTERLNYYIFENNQRLRFKFLSFPKKNPNPATPYETLAAVANEADIATFPITPNDTVVQEYNASYTVPFMYSYNTILTRKNATVKEDAPGPFNDMLSVSLEVWLSVMAKILLLTIVGILEERINGMKRPAVRNFGDKIYGYYRVLLGQGISLPALPAIRISNGFWLLELLIFINLFGGLMKANYTARPSKNINSIEDVSKAPDLNVAIYHANEFEICNTEVESFINLCERFKKQSKRMKMTNTMLIKLLLNGEVAWIGDFNIFVVFINDCVKRCGPKYKFEFKNKLYISSNKYLTKPIIYFVSKNINPEALKIINKRFELFKLPKLNSEFELGLVVWINSYH